MLAKVLQPRLETKDTEKDDIDRNLRILNRAYEVYEAAKRPDLAINLCLLKGSYLEKVDRRDVALKLYVSASQMYADQHYGVRDLFDRALVMLDGNENVRKRLAFCESVIKKIPRQRGPEDKKTGELNPSYVYVARAYIRTLQDAGQNALAADWEAKLKTK